MGELNRGARAVPMACAVGLALGLAACQAQDGSRASHTDAPATGAVEEEAVVTPEPEKKSIIREDIETPATPAPVLEPETLMIPFPAKGAAPDETGLAVLDEFMTHPVFKAEGPITIWGHSDSKGSDSQNLAASRRRAEAVRDYLVKQGVPRDRITVIALGEARPIAPNRKLDGSDDMEGRAKNRRVEIKVDLPPPPSDTEAASGTGG
ncbi:OmpA family protein [Novosphingobium kaempferiae]|uniref:OmpA family protein n=1 Tax=Novosphingobium kaempferiae TaxID=2896849 RepID=UPI001E37D806|nr:OmpA family protein [Novosphingobium kaempferiae]